MPAPQQCQLCSSDQLELVDSDVQDFEYGSPGSFDYWKCRQCELLHIFPVPTEDQLGLAYPEIYHAYHEHHSPLARFLKKRFWKKKASRYSLLVKNHASILEAGCSFGDLLHEFRELGFQSLQGLDFNPRAVEKARERGLEIQQGDLETCDLPEGGFQMIVMENFIEHVYDPVATLQCCNRLLETGGILAGETPNTAAWDYQWFRRHWGGYHTPRHLYLFNFKNMKLLAEKSGFEVLGISNLLQPAHWALCIQNKLQDSRWKTTLQKGRSFYFIGLLLFAIPLNLIQSMFSQTSSVEFIFKKVRSI